MYKFEVYRNSNVSTTGDFVDFDRYDVDSYVFERKIEPLWEDLAFEWSKENDRAFFRKNLTGEFTLMGSDYNWINQIRLDSSERNKYRILYVYEKIDGSWVEAWRGFISVIVGEWNISRCSVKFSDLITFDEYSRYLENTEEERNLIDIPPFTINIDSQEYLFDEMTVRTLLSPFDPSSPCDFTLPPLSSSEVFDVEKYTLYSRNVSLNYFGTAWEIVKVYRRDYVIQVNSPGASWQDLGIYPDVASGNAEHKFVRNYLGYSSPTYSETTAYAPVSENRACEYIARDLNISDAPGIEDYANDRARPFIPVINYATYGSLDSSSYYIYSTFFTATTNPVTGESNQYNKMYVIQFTDIEETSDPATRALYSFKDVESWLRIINVYWYVDDYGVRFEHKQFFDSGLTYGDNNIGIDVTGNPKQLNQARKTSVFSYDNKSIPRIYELKMSYESGDDFYGTPIIYTGSMANWGDENKFTLSIQKLATDVRGAILNKDAGKDGFFLVATSIGDGGQVYVINGTGAWSGVDIYNSPLSVANIEDKLWRWGAKSAIGVLNGSYTEFDNIEPNFAQEEFSITWCDDFDPYKLVRTEYGDGNVVSAVRSLKDNRLTLTLSYEA